MLKFSNTKYLTIVAATAALFAACNDDCIPEIDTATDPDSESQVTDLGYDLQLYIQGELKTSARSERLMYSSVPNNNINEVWMRLFIKEDTVWKSAENHAHIWAMVADSIFGDDVREYTTAEGNVFHYIDLTEKRRNRVRWHDDENVNISFADGFRLKFYGLLPNREYMITATGYNTPMNYEFIYEDNNPVLEAQWYPNKVVDGGQGDAMHDEMGEVVYESEKNPETGLVINNVIPRREEELFHGATVMQTDELANISSYKCTNHDEPTTILNSAGIQLSAARVEMFRQVAGILGYFKNIPTHVPVTDEYTGLTEDIEVVAVRVVCAARSSRICMNDSLLNTLNFSDTPSFQYGYPETVFTIPIPKDAEKGYTDDHGNYVQYKIWHIPPKVIDLNNKYATVRNSVIGSGFWLSVPKETFVNPSGMSFDATTFQIQLLGEPEQVLRTFTVKRSDDETSFPVCRDFFYSFGQKLGSGLGSSRPEEDIYYEPEGNEDAPIDLSKQDDIILTVADAWDESHFFVIGAQQSTQSTY